MTLSPPISKADIGAKVMRRDGKAVEVKSVSRFYSSWNDTSEVLFSTSDDKWHSLDGKIYKNHEAPEDIVSRIDEQAGDA